MKREDILELDPCLVSTWESCERFFLDSLRRGEFKEANTLLESYPQPTEALGESKCIVLGAACLANLGLFDKALEMVKRAKHHNFPHFYYFDPAWGSYEFRPKPDSDEWFNQNGHSIHHGPHKVELHCLLSSLYTSDKIQEYVQKNFNARIHPWGFDLEWTPFCWLEQTTLNRIKAECEVSKEKVVKGTTVYSFQYFNGSFDVPTQPFVAEVESLEKAKKPNQNRLNYENNSYELTDFAFKTGYSNRRVCAFWNSLKTFSLDETLDLIGFLRTSPCC